MLGKLFLAFLQIGCMSFGGGYASLPLIQQVVLQHHWLNKTEMAQLITISQMTPGPIAVNAATFVGQRVAGTMGGIVATFGCIFPALLICTILVMFYMHYRKLDFVQKVFARLRPIIIALIGAGAISILQSSFSTSVFFTIVSFGICLFLLQKKKTSPIWVMVFSGLMYVGIKLISE